MGFLHALCASVVHYFYHGDTEVTERKKGNIYSVILRVLCASVVHFFLFTTETQRTQRKINLNHVVFSVVIRLFAGCRLSTPAH